MSDLTNPNLNTSLPYGDVARVRRTDDRGRYIMADMTDREIAEETLWLLRAFGDALTDFSQSPMARMLPGMSGMSGINFGVMTTVDNVAD